MKTLVKILIAILIIWIVWEILTGLIGLLVGIAIAGLLVFGAVKLLEGPRRG